MKEYFPAHVRLKCLMLDLIMGLEDAMASTKDQWADVAKAERYIERISTSRKGCFSCLPLHEGQLVLSPSQYNQYRKRIELLRKTIETFWPKTVDAREFLIVCIEVVEVVFKTLHSAPKKEQAYWMDLITAMDDLYGDYDPDLKALPQMERGEKISEVLVKVANGG